VIEALVYACFIFIIPLCMVPSGYKFLINWAGALIWLQAWAPMYAILNFLMNIAARSMTLSEMGATEGLTIANYMGVSEANEHIKLMAGYLSLSIPFICIAIVKGVGSVRTSCRTDDGNIDVGSRISGSRSIFRQLLVW